jgi:hypothetical protein
VPGGWESQIEIFSPTWDPGIDREENSTRQDRRTICDSKSELEFRMF